MSFIQTIREKITALSKKQRIIAVLLLVVLFFVFASLDRTPSEEATVSETKEVSLISVLESSTESTPLNVTGTVQSESEATLRTESQGEVIGVYTSVGSFVRAGTVLAELRNNSERAAVAQAQAGLDAARANLIKGTSGARDEEQTVLSINLENARSSYATARNSAVTSLQSSYAAVDDAIVASADDLFSNPASSKPVLNLATSESEVANRLVQNRVMIEAILNRQATKRTTLSVEDNLLGEISTTKEEVAFVRTFLDDLLTVINAAIPTQSTSESLIASYKASITGARSAITGTDSTLTGATDALNNTLAGVQIAEQNLSIGETGAQAEDVAALEAAVNQAEAGLAQARANLARTLIVSPISGTVNTLSLRKGEFANAFELAAVVSNNNALEIETFVTENDKNQIRVGSKAIIEGRYDGVVTSVSPGLDPVTKKIEVRVGVVDTDTNITHGSSVRVAIDRNGFDIDVTEVDEISIPISALKIETNRTVVFTVDVEDKLIAHEVETGLVLGDSVVITSGLTPDMRIVSDARGLREGQLVALTN